MGKKRKSSEVDMQPTLKEAAKDAFERAEVASSTSKVLKKLPTATHAKKRTREDAFLKKIKEEVKKSV